MPPLSNEIDQMSASVRFDFFRLVLLDACDILCIAEHAVFETVVEMAPFPGLRFGGLRPLQRRRSSEKTFFREDALQDMASLTRLSCQ